MTPDDSHTRAKAVRQGYSQAPFYLMQQNAEGEVRLVAWTPELAQLKRVVYAILETFPDHVEVLLKIDTGEVGADGIVWQRYAGSASKTVLREAMLRAERYVFQDSDNQFCVKRPDTDEYLALDHCGVLYIYSSSPRMAELCAEAGFARQDTAELISDAGHWRVSPKDGTPLRDQLIQQLGLVLVEP